MGSDGRSKCICFFFLSPNLAAILSTAVMIGVSVGSYYLNIMINEEIGPFLLHVARVFGVCVIISLVAFIIGILFNNMILIKQYATIYAVYIFFSLSCFCCNFITLIFGNCYRESYNLYTVYVDYYLKDHPTSELEDDQIKELVKKTFYISTALHILTLCLMIYYYSVTSAYIEERRQGKDEYGQKFVAGTNKSSSNYYESDFASKKSNI